MSTLQQLQQTISSLTESQQEKLLTYAKSLESPHPVDAAPAKRGSRQSLMKYAGCMHTDDPTFCDNGRIDADIAAEAAQGLQEVKHAS